MTAIASKPTAQCAGKVAGSFVGVDLAEPITAPHPLVLGAAVCGHHAKGGSDTFSIAVKKGDCVEIDFHAKGASLTVSGAGINVSAMGDDVSLVHAAVAGTLLITVSASAADDYSLLVR